MFFEYPKLLFLLLLLVPLAGWYLYRELKGKNVPSLQVSSLQPFFKDGISFRKIIYHVPFALRMITLAALIIAIARPRSSSDYETTSTEGIDIMLAMDVSTSMLARDFQPDRIAAAKDIAIQFIAERPTDRIGIVVFAGESYTQCPLTTDRITLINMMKEVQTGLMEDGTAIGNGLATAVARLKDSDAVSRVVILLTDGVNNRGEVTPLTAAEIARTYGIRVYTIGVGAHGMAPYPIMTPYGVQIQQVKVEIDEDLLKQIAGITGGEYFRATDNTKLLSIYNQINQMEKSRTLVDSFPVYREMFMKFALVALFALALEFLLRWIVLRRIP
ncbi:MAG: VWA domain-containing protein [Bacteroidales bacterium]|jgi:Ca-activated chloride channel family protein|nr:VWA domain-containing protein [Bacteroidales bacterium]MDD2263941.1 VWA domain-containing protein [Bacteroidales bacterium]MDD2831175.1 VWA domain-containing protein [Bacteroidales bacterium]MDD3209286.1 VWA domain-containing protein [Bacteroidales bacterium]MDD3697587.1 VWA domain-containing protein [Bacteroidales bacterium]